MVCFEDPNAFSLSLSCNVEKLAVRFHQITKWIIPRFSYDNKLYLFRTINLALKKILEVCPSLASIPDDMCVVFLILYVFVFRWAVCQHCALPQRDQPVPSGGAAGSQMEAVQQRGDPNLPEQSIPTWRLFFFGFHTPFIFVWHYSVMQSQSKTCHFRWLEA